MSYVSMSINSLTFQTNPDSDSDWSYAVEQAVFLPVDSTQDITQVLGVHSGVRVFEGYFQADAAYATLEAFSRLAVPVTVIDWKGNTYTALILDLTPAFVVDVITQFQTRRYKMTLRRVNG